MSLLKVFIPLYKWNNYSVTVSASLSSAEKVLDSAVESLSGGEVITLSELESISRKFYLSFEELFDTLKRREY